LSSSGERRDSKPTRSVRCAVISTDGAFRKIVEQAIRHPDAGTTLEIEFGVPFAAFGNAELKALKAASPEVVVLDLAEDPALGIKLAHFLAGSSSPSYKIIASGPTLEAELLLELMRGGITEFLPKPVAPEQVREAVRRLAQGGQGAGAQQGTTLGEIYAFFGAKGGSGATTLATNLAIVLHRLTKKKTLLVDLDVELGEASLLLGIQPRFNFVDLIQNFHRVDAGLLASYIERHDSGVHLLSAPFHPDRAQEVSADQIRRILQYLRQHYDYVVVDVSKSFTPATFAAFEQADRIFLTTTVDLPSLRNVQRALPLLQRVVHGKDRINLLLNRFDKGGDVTTKEVERSLGIPVYATLSNDYEAVIRSVNTGKPVVMNGTSAYSQDLNRLGSLITGVKPQQTPSGAFQRLTSGLSRVVPGRRRESKS